MFLISKSTNQYLIERSTCKMGEKKITLRVDEAIYTAFVAKCQENGLRLGEVIATGIEEDCDHIISLTVAKNERRIREVKEAQILKLQEELGYTESDMKRLLKSSKQAVTKPAKEEKVLESRQAHEGTYDDEAVMWEVDRFGSGYYCHTSDGKTHKKDVNGNITS